MTSSMPAPTEAAVKSEVEPTERVAEPRQEMHVDLARLEAEARVENAKDALTAWRARLWSLYDELGVEDQVLMKLKDLEGEYVEEVEREEEAFRDPEKVNANLHAEEYFSPIGAATATFLIKVQELLGSDVIAVVDKEREQFEKDFAATRGLATPPFIGRSAYAYVAPTAYVPE